jgi:hypothetical protein
MFNFFNLTFKRQGIPVPIYTKNHMNLMKLHLVTFPLKSLAAFVTNPSHIMYSLQLKIDYEQRAEFTQQ